MTSDTKKTIEDIDLIKLLIESANEAARRSRWVLMAAIIISMIQFGASYNFAFSQLRPLIEYLTLDCENTTPKNTLPLGANNKPPIQNVSSFDTSSNTTTGKANTNDNESNLKDIYLKDLRSSLIKAWIDQLSVNINIIGLKFSAMDTGFLGSIAILIIMIWLYCNINREHNTVAKAVDAASKEETPTTKLYVYHGITSRRVFSVMTDDKKTVSEDDGSRLQYWFSRKASRMLFLIPVIAVFGAIFADLYNLVDLKAVFRGSCDSYMKLFVNAPDNDTGHNISKVKTMFFAKLAMEIGLFAAVAWISALTMAMHKATEKRLEALHRDIEAA